MKYFHRIVKMVYYYEIVCKYLNIGKISNSLVQKWRNYGHICSETPPLWCESLILVHWGRVTHKCLSKVNIIGLDNGLSLERRQTNVGILLTHWDRVTHICVVNLTTIGSDNGLSPGRRQAIIWTNAGINSNLRNKFQWNLNLYSHIFIQEIKCIWKCRLENVGHFVSASAC